MKSLDVHYDHPLKHNCRTRHECKHSSSKLTSLLVLKDSPVRRGSCWRLEMSGVFEA